MEVKLTAKFQYRGSKDSTTISWVEKNPKIIQRKQDSDEILREITLTVEGVKQEYRKLLVNYKNEGKAFSIQDTNGKIHVIDLTEVRNVELDAVEVGSEKKVSDDATNVTQFDSQANEGTKRKKPTNIADAMGVQPKRHTLN